MRNILLISIAIFISLRSYTQCTLTLQPAPQSGKDARIFSLDCSESYALSTGNCDTTNWGDLYFISAEVWTFGGTLGVLRGLIEFDLSTVNSLSCSVSNAKLILKDDGASEGHCGQYSGWHPCFKNDFEILRATQYWDEYEVNWVNQPSFSPDTLTTTNRIYIDDSSATPYATYNIDVTDMVNFWLTNPDSNFGFMIKMMDESDPYRRVRFASSDNENQYLRPKLVLSLACDSSKCNNVVSGKLFDDTNKDCIFNNTDIGLEDWLIKIEPGPIYASADEFGNWSANVDVGDYTITPVVKNKNLWSDLCLSSYIVNFTSSDTSAENLDFPLVTKSYCAELWVDIGVARMRKCHDEWFKVSYCNNGNIAQDSIYIDVKFDDFIHPKGASIPYTVNSDSTLRFNIGMLQPYECDFFLISTIIDCQVEFGTTQCANATIYPRNICESIDTSWDKSSIAVDGECVGDSLVCFTISNIGDGDMEASSEWRLYTDNFLVETGTFQLNGQETTELCFAATGETMRLEADQRPGHPGDSRPRATIENCGVGGTATTSSITVTEDDADSYTETICDVILASYDPNEKVEKPYGITENKYISAKDELEYTIHFQNTGNAPALLVIVRDTLSEHLDASTIVSGVSSHNYKFSMHGNGILEWRFDDINLIDSTTDEPNSHGYVKFKIKQQPANAKGTLIENRVGIYFDFNEPVITEYAWNIVWDTTLTHEPTEYVVESTGFDFVVYPNPTENLLNFRFKKSGNYTIRLLNLVGQELQSETNVKQTTQINVESLRSGVYLFEITNDDGSKSIGEFIKE